MMALRDLRLVIAMVLGSAISASARPVSASAGEADLPMRNPGMMGTGVGLMVHGGVALHAGAVLVAFRMCNDTDPPQCKPAAPYWLGASMLAHGAIALGIGIV